MNHPNDFYHQPTAGEIPALKPPTTRPLDRSPYSVIPPDPVTPPPVKPPAHYQPIPPRPIVDPIQSHAERAIHKYAEQLVMALKPQCMCEVCRHATEIILADFASEMMTDITIIKLALGKQEREFERLNDALQRVLPPLLRERGHQ